MITMKICNSGHFSVINMSTDWTCYYHNLMTVTNHNASNQHFPKQKNPISPKPVNMNARLITCQDVFYVTIFVFLSCIVTLCAICQKILV